MLADSYRAITEKLDTSAASVVPSDIAEFIQNQKDDLKVADVDVRDAKRRVTSAKGPRKGRKAETEANAEDSEGSISEDE